MANDKSGPGWRPKSAAEKRPQKGWRAVDPNTTGGSTRNVKLFFLGGMGLAVLVGIVFLIMYLASTKRPGIVAIAADPGLDSKHAVARLDVPYDPFGWRSASQLLTWAEKASSDRNMPLPLGRGGKPFWLDADENEWIDAVTKDSTIDPVIIYIGLHGGVNSNGEPILYTGRDDATKSEIRETDRYAVRLKTILDLLDEKAPNKRKVLILDTGRRAPDPLLGEIYPDFSRAVQEKLGEQIKRNPTLAVILGCDDRERAWESPELGMTPLAYFLMKRLSGDTSEANKHAFTGEELFEYLEDQVVQWARNNRPTAQTPILLPGREQWKADAVRREKHERYKFFLPKEPIVLQTDPVPAIDAKKWAENEECARLASLNPSPAVYTPVAWRRYRELLLRYDQALAAGDEVGAGALAKTLGELRDTITKGLELNDTLKESVKVSLTLGQALGKPLETSAKARQALERATTLSRAATDGKSALAGLKAPVEVHLPIMLQHFVTRIVPDSTDLNATWRAAVTCRMLAEQTAVGVTNETSPFPYSERLWPLIRDEATAADAIRRQGEDRMLAIGDTVKADAQRAFAEADKQYTATRTNAAILQRAWRVRDEALADLPFLSHWHTEADLLDADVKIARVREAWKKTFELSRLLDRLEPKKIEWPPLVTTTAAVEELLTELRGTVTEAANRSRAAKSQSDWQEIQHLLTVPPPLIPSEKRIALAQLSREITGALIQATAQANAPKQAKSEMTKAKYRLEVAAESLAGPWMQWAIGESHLAKPDPTVTAEKLDHSAKQADLLLAHRRAQAKFSEHPATTAADRELAETFSRLSAPFTQIAEPATLNALQRWKNYLDGMAVRMALDHWYDENGQPYLTQLSKQLLTDADKIGTRVNGSSKPAESADVKQAKMLIAAVNNPLKVECADKEGPIVWTTEQQRAFLYRLGPTNYPVPGEAVLWWKMDEQARSITIDAPVRQPVSLQQLADQKSTVTASIAQSLETRINRNERLQASGYFRGQYLQQTTKIEIDNRPDLVITDALPPPKAALALRAVFDPGAVSILIDYSGSMTDPWKGSDDKQKSKKNIVIETLQALLRKLPRTTKLTVRVMYKNKTLEDKNSERIFPRDPAMKVITDEALDNLFKDLRAMDPDGPTPLIPCMADSMADIDTKYEGVKTLIVLTDGADTTRQREVFGNRDRVVTAKEMKQQFPDERKKMIDLIDADVRKFATAEKTKDIAIQMVIFGGDEDEESLAEQMFKSVAEVKDTRFLGKVHVAKSQTDLQRELDEALRPKVQLLELNGTPVHRTQNTNIPSNGIPATRTEDANSSGTLRWNGPLDPNTYLLSYFNTKRRITFDRSDAMCVAMTKRGSEGAIEFERELYFKKVDGVRPAGRAVENGDWLLTAPEFGYRSQNGFFLTTTAALESLNGRTPGPDGVLTQFKPTFTWWDFNLFQGNTEKRFPGTVYVRRAYGTPAPCWRVVADSGQVRPNDPANPNKAEYRLHSRPFFTDPKVLGRTDRLTSGSLATGFEQDISEVKVRVKFETIAFRPHPSVDSFEPLRSYQGRQEKCLVVRLTDPQGRLLRVNVSKGGDLPLVQHLYYYKKADNPNALKPDALRPAVIGTTAIFGPIPDNFSSERPETEITIFNLTESLNDDRVKGLKLDLTMPSESPTAVDLVPQLKAQTEGNVE